MSDSAVLRELKVFISSPGDVSEERVLAAQVIERLRLEFAGSIRLTTVLWEHEPLFAHAGFQEQLPLPSECDLVLSILWSRIGTRLHPRFARPQDGRVLTGTEFEIEDALESYRRTGRPNLLVFVKDAAVEGDLRATDIQARVTQRRDLEEFIRVVLVERPGLGLAAHHRFASSWEFARRVEDQLRKWLQQRVGVDLKAQAAWRESPYRGLEVFEAEHRLIYCGRGRAISQVLGRLRTLAAAMAAWTNRPPAVRATATADTPTAFDEPRMFLLVQGMSGNGKSSLIRAGILPLLQVGAVEGVGGWRQAILRPSDRDGDLVLTLAHALTAVGALPELVDAGETVESLAADLRAAPNGTLGRLKGYLAQAAAKRGLQANQVRLVVFIDQLEELFTDSRIDAEARRTFCRMLDSLACGQQAWVVATLRSDFAHRCEEIPELGDLRRGRVFELDKPRTDELQAMIEEPAKLAGLRFEEQDGERLSRQILRDAEGNAEVLPLLEYALSTLYERRDDEGRLTRAAYAASGGLRGTLVGEAERVLLQLGSAGEPALTPVLRELVGVDDSGTATRRRVANTVFDTNPDQRRLVDALVRARLLAAQSEESGPSLSVAHEALITHWPRVTAWLLSEKRLLVQRNELAQRALSWQRADRADDFLLPAGLPLLHALEVRAAGFVLDELQHEFLEQSLAADAARQRREQEQQQAEEAKQREIAELKQRWAHRKRLITRVSMASLAVVALLLGAFAWVSWTQMREAKLQTAQVQFGEARRLLQQPSTFATGVDTLARSLAGGLRMDTQGLQLVLADLLERRPILGAGPHRLPLASKDASAAATFEAGWPLMPLRHERVVMSAVFSPDGRQVLTASVDNTAQVWDEQTGAPLTPPLRHDEPVSSAVFSADGHRVLTVSYDEAARVWDAQTGAPLGPPLRDEGGVNSAIFSTDGRRVLTASGDFLSSSGTALVWDTQTGKPLSPPMRHGHAVNSAVFSADSRRVLTASRDKTARIWDAQTGAPLSAPLHHEDSVNSAVFSADGRRVLTASDDHTARLWDTQTGAPLSPHLRHEGAVYSAVFSADGRRVLTASKDKTARVWDAQTGASLCPPLRHDGAVNSAVFSADGRRVLTASRDKTARVWDAQTGAPLSPPLHHDEAVISAVFSADNRRVLTSSRENMARVWDARPGGPPSLPLLHEYPVNSAVFSADGRRALTASGDNTARVWDAQTGAPLSAPLPVNNADFNGTRWLLVNSAFFSADGRWVLTASDDTARVWDAQTGAPLSPPLKHEYAVNSAVFSSDGRRVLTASDDKTARVWDVQTGAPLSPPLRHEDAVNSAVFSTDGRVLTASSDFTARVWDAGRGAPLSPPLSHEYPVNSAVFSADGSRVLTASRDKTARVWDAQTGAPLSLPLRHEKAVNGAVFSTDSRRVLTASADSTARVWDAQTGAPLSPSLRHEDAVNSAVFSTDGRRVLSASADNTARVWDAQTGAPLSPPMRHEGAVTSAVFSADGGRVLTASWDNTARVWPLTDYAMAAGGVLGGILSQLVSCKDDPGLGDASRCDTVAADQIPLAAAINGLQDAELRATLRYHLLGDGSAHPLLVGTEFAQDLPGLRRALGVNQGLLQYWWTATDSAELGAGWCLAASTAGGVEMDQGLATTLTLFRSQPLSDYAKQDIDLAELRVSALGTLHLGGVDQHLWESATIIDPTDLPRLGLSAPSKVTAIAPDRVPLRDTTTAADRNDDEADQLPATAAEAYRNAIELGDDTGTAHRSLALLTELGAGVERDLATALVLLRASAGLGNLDAQFDLATRLEQGIGAPPNPAEAITWYAKAAAQGHANAAYRLGQMYEDGIGDSADKVNAAGWYRLAAQQGHVASHYALARLILEDVALKASNLDLAQHALKHLIESAPAPLEGQGLSELRWLAEEAVWLANTHQLQVPALASAPLPESTVPAPPAAR